MQPRQVIRGVQCWECYKVSARFTNEQAQSKLNSINLDFEIVGEYLGSNRTMKFLHTKCGNITTSNFDRITRRKRFCRFCVPIKRKSFWCKPTENSYGRFDSLLEFECYLFLLKIFSENDIKQYYPYPGVRKYNADFYIQPKDLYIEVSSICKPWYYEKILKKRQLVKSFIFAQSVKQLELFF